MNKSYQEEIHEPNRRTKIVGYVQRAFNLEPILRIGLKDAEESFIRIKNKYIPHYTMSGREYHSAGDITKQDLVILADIYHAIHVTSSNCSDHSGRIKLLPGLNSRAILLRWQVEDFFRKSSIWK